MTRFYVDNREIQPPIDVSSLNQLLRHIEDVHLPPETVVRQIRIDGLPLNAVPAEQSDFSCRIDQRERIEIFTGSFAEIARESIKDALQYLGRIEAAIPSLIKSFQDSPGPESFENLKQLYEGLYWLNLLLDKLKTKFQMDLNHHLIQGSPVSVHHQTFISVLKELIESQKKGDFSLVSDLLEYEILSLIPVWRELFGVVAGKLEPKSLSQRAVK